MASSKRTVAVLYIVGVTLLPVLLGLSRDIVMKFAAHQSGIATIPMSAQMEHPCGDETCELESRFIIQAPLLKDLQSPTFAYHSAMPDSYPVVNGTAIGPISKRSQISMSWFKFRIFPLPAGVASSDTLVDIVSVRPVVGKLLSLSHKELFLGSAPEIESLASIFTFFNIHLYIVWAFLIFAFGIGISLTDSARQADSEVRIRIQTVVAVVVLFSYSHYFDQWLLLCKVPKALVEGNARLYFGPIVALFFFRDLRTAIIASCVYIAALLPGLFEWGHRDFFFGTLNQCGFALATTVAIGAVAYRIVHDREKHDWLYVPFLLLAVKDALTLLGLIPLTNGLYLWPLGILGLLVVSTTPHIRKIWSALDHVKRAKVMSKIFERLQQTNNMNSTADWKLLLQQTCAGLARATSATKIGAVYLRLEQPITTTFDSGQFSVKQDGRIHEVFSRVIFSTKELLWVDDIEDFKKTFTPQKKPSSALRIGMPKYRSGTACLVPIIVQGEVYGALALTDFEELDDIDRNPERKAEIKNEVMRYVNFLSALLIKGVNDKSIDRQRRSNELSTMFIRRCSRISNRSGVIEAFLNSVYDVLPCQSLFFSFNEADQRLRLEATCNLSDELTQIWGMIPFRARSENRHSPFGVNINDRRCVTTVDIFTHNVVLGPETKNALRESRSKGFFSAPVISGERILGIFCLLDEKKVSEDILDAEFVLHFPLKSFADQLALVDAKSESVKHEKVLRRLVDSSVVRAVVSSDSKMVGTIGSSEHGYLLFQRVTLADGSTDGGNGWTYAQQVADLYHYANPLIERLGGFVGAVKSQGITSVIPLDVENRARPLETCLQYIDVVGAQIVERTKNSSGPVIFHRGEYIKGVVASGSSLRSETISSDLDGLIAIDALLQNEPNAILVISFQFLFHLHPELMELFVSNALKRMNVSGFVGGVFLYDKKGYEFIKTILAHPNFVGTTSGGAGRKI